MHNTIIQLWNIESKCLNLKHILYHQKFLVLQTTALLEVKNVYHKRYITMTGKIFFLFFQQMWQFAPNSVHYLLSLWQRMVASVPYVKATEPHMLETYTPEVMKAYVMSRLESVTVVVKQVLYCLIKYVVSTLFILDRKLYITN